MVQSDSTLTSDGSNLTQHAMLIVWGHYARTIGLLERLAEAPIAQKKVVRAPQKIAEFLVGLLSGMEYLTDLSEGPAPLTKDTEVSTAWKLQAMADASGVSRTLQACTDETVQGLAGERAQAQMTQARAVASRHCEGERAGQGRRTHISMGPLAGTGLLVKVHGRQRLCWSVPGARKAMGCAATAAFPRKFMNRPFLAVLASGCTKATQA